MALHAVVELKQMQNYRVLGVATMRQLITAQLELVRMTRRCKAGKPPKPEELEAVLWRFAEPIRSIDWAHKFLVVYGQPLKKAKRYENLRQQYMPELAHRP